jgi:hypothetical protein
MCHARVATPNASLCIVFHASFNNIRLPISPFIDENNYQSTAHPFSARKSAQASFKARFGLSSSTRSGSLVKGSV